MGRVLAGPSFGSLLTRHRENIFHRGRVAAMTERLRFRWHEIPRQHISLILHLDSDTTAPRFLRSTAAILRLLNETSSSLCGTGVET
jgi:hypothetical protein